MRAWRCIVDAPKLNSENFFRQSRERCLKGLAVAPSVRLSLLGVHHLKRERVGKRLVDVDKADEYRCLVVGASYGHLEVAFGDPAEETPERSGCAATAAVRASIGRANAFPGKRDRFCLFRKWHALRPWAAHGHSIHCSNNQQQPT